MCRSMAETESNRSGKEEAEAEDRWTVYTNRVGSELFMIQRFNEEKRKCTIKFKSKKYPKVTWQPGIRHIWAVDTNCRCMSKILVPESRLFLPDLTTRHLPLIWD